MTSTDAEKSSVSFQLNKALSTKMNSLATLLASLKPSNKGKREKKQEAVNEKRKILRSVRGKSPFFFFSFYWYF